MIDLLRGPDQYFLYHLIRSLYLVNISMTDLGFQRPEENFKTVLLKMTKLTDQQYLSYDIFTGFQPNVVKFSTLAKDTIFGFHVT